MPWPFVGTAGWSLPKTSQPAFPDLGTHLERYAARFTAVEINSSFYRSHRPATYARWAASVPPHFRFAVKMPGTITHEHKLVGTDALLDAFLTEVQHLGPTLGPLLVQLPPSLAFSAPVAERFLRALRARHTGAVALEARHATWFDEAADALLVAHRVSGVAADPARVPRAAEPSGKTDLVYYRLHGSPVIYRSPYEPAYLDALRRTLGRWRESGSDVWCIFDNTANGAATENALATHG